MKGKINRILLKKKIANNFQFSLFFLSSFSSFIFSSYFIFVSIFLHFSMFFRTRSHLSNQKWCKIATGVVFKTYLFQREETMIFFCLVCFFFVYACGIEIIYKLIFFYFRINSSIKNIQNIGDIGNTSLQLQPL